MSISLRKILKEQGSYEDVRDISPDLQLRYSIAKLPKHRVALSYTLYYRGILIKSEVKIKFSLLINRTIEAIIAEALTISTEELANIALRQDANLIRRFFAIRGHNKEGDDLLITGDIIVDNNTQLLLLGLYINGLFNKAVPQRVTDALTTYDSHFGRTSYTDDIGFIVEKEEEN